ncbi:MAG: hypothetical protein SOZ09_06135 [Eubacteriales bacterium]|nr:hypothetical protein [Clostridiales bacterium]MDD7773249.1 hypothetical protein [Eubacteriales bacterium]MDY3941550.1 hypothetical protein [Eubacteriales bacterium]
MKKKEEIERFCKYCENADELTDGDTMLCKTHGIVSAGFCCRKFRYDPLKRTPAPIRRIADDEMLRLDYVDI